MQLSDCPFCGNELDCEDSDTLHKSTTAWREDPYGPPGQTLRHYVRYNDPRGIHGRCYEVHCNTIYGGCGAQISGDSLEETILKWNTRTS